MQVPPGASHGVQAERVKHSSHKGAVPGAGPGHAIDGSVDRWGVGEDQWANNRVEAGRGRSGDCESSVAGEGRVPRDSTPAPHSGCSRGVRRHVRDVEAAGATPVTPIISGVESRSATLVWGTRGGRCDSCHSDQHNGAVAQPVEHWSEEPRVGGANPSRPIHRIHGVTEAQETEDLRAGVQIPLDPFVEC